MILVERSSFLLPLPREPRCRPPYLSARDGYQCDSPFARTISAAGEVNCRLIPDMTRANEPTRNRSFTVHAKPPGVDIMQTSLQSQALHSHLTLSSTTIPNLHYHSTPVSCTWASSLSSLFRTMLMPNVEVQSSVPQHRKTQRDNFPLMRKPIIRTRAI